MSSVKNRRDDVRHYLDEVKNWSRCQKRKRRKNQSPSKASASIRVMNQTLLRTVPLCCHKRKTEELSWLFHCAVNVDVDVDVVAFVVDSEDLFYMTARRKCPTIRRIIKGRVLRKVFVSKFRVEARPLKEKNWIANTQRERESCSASNWKRSVVCFVSPVIMASKTGSFLGTSDRQKILRDLQRKGELTPGSAPEAVRKEAAEVIKNHYANNTIEAEPFGTGCLACGADDDHANLLLCEACNAEYHTYVHHNATRSDPIELFESVLQKRMIPSEIRHRIGFFDCRVVNCTIDCLVRYGQFLRYIRLRSLFLVFLCNSFFLVSTKRYCLEPPLRSVPAGEWYCRKFIWFLPVVQQFSVALRN